MLDYGAIGGAATVAAWVVERLLWLLAGGFVGMVLEWRWNVFYRALLWLSSWLEARGWTHSEGSGSR